MEKKEQDELLKEYGAFLTYKAKYYSTRGMDYDEVYQQAWVYLLETLREGEIDPCLKTTEDITRAISSGLRTYYNKHNRERTLTYGLSPEDCFR